jgi:hypothetical protein
MAVEWVQLGYTFPDVYRMLDLFAGLEPRYRHPLPRTFESDLMLFGHDTARLQAVPCINRVVSVPHSMNGWLSDGVYV